MAETARRLHVSRQTLRDLLAERKGFTPEMALRVGKLAGNGATLWTVQGVGSTSPPHHAKPRNKARARLTATIALSPK